MKIFKEFIFMYCPNCGAEHHKGIDLCSNCGNKLTRPGLKDQIFHGAGKNTGDITCPHCRNTEYNKNFCVKCGYNLNDVLGYFPPKGAFSDDQYYLELNKNYLKVQKHIQSEFDSTWYEFTFLYEKIENFEITVCQRTKKLSIPLLSAKTSTYPCLKFTYNEDLQWESYPLKLFCDGENSIKIPVNEKYVSEINNIITSNPKFEK